MVPVYLHKLPNVSELKGGQRKGDSAQRTNYRQMKEDPSLPFSFSPSFPLPSLSTFFSPLILES